MSVQSEIRLATEKMKANHTLFKELTKIVKGLRWKEAPQALVKKSDINKLIFDETGILALFKVTPHAELDAYALLPDIDDNHPFMNRMDEDFKTANMDRIHLNRFGSITGTKAWVDPVNFKVGGAWSNVPVTVCITKGLLDTRVFSDENIAGMILHEIGHVFTYFSLLGDLTNKNILIREAVKTALGAAPLEKRVQVLERVESDLHIGIKGKEHLLQTNESVRGEILETVIVTEVVNKRLNVTKTQDYNIRNSEQLADQFAVYMGAGQALVEATVKAERMAGDAVFYTDRTFIQLELVKAMLFMYLTYQIPLIGIVIFFLGVPGKQLYDEPAARVALMRKQLVASLKDTKHIPDLHKQILSQIEAIDELSKLLKDRRTLFTLVYQTITPRGRSIYRQELFSKSVENLLYNETHLNAAKFGALNNVI